MLFNQNQFLEALSFALDFLEMDVLKSVTHHNKKVAYISDCLAEAMGLNLDDRLDLATCALLHDSGVAAYKYQLMERREGFENAKEHCIHSQHILDVFPLRQPRESILLHHHEYIDGSGFFGIKNPPLLSQIILLADCVDMEYVAGSSREEIIEYIDDPTLFYQEIIDAFKKVAVFPAFWMDLDPLFINVALHRIPENICEKSWPEIRQLTKVISTVIDKKSTFTSNHSAGLSARAEAMGNYYGFSEDKIVQFVIAADLHDLGKLAIPNAILDKPDKLDNTEFAMMQKHTYYTRRALETIDGFEEITEWASNHHEKTTGRGYPFGKMDLDFESRLMAVLDIYQALAEDRPYRSGLSHQESMDIIIPLGQFGGLDPKIISDVDKIFGKK